jgi:hypothetical protein
VLERSGSGMINIEDVRGEITPNVIKKKQMKTYD